MLEWDLIQSDWYPYNKRKFGHVEKYQGCAHTEKRLYENIARKGLSASHGEKPWREPDLDLNFKASRIVSNKFLLSKTSSFWYLVRAGHAN